MKRASTTIMLDRACYRLSTVFTGLISNERRLTQRIVEMARAPASYIGNLVSEGETSSSGLRSEIQQKYQFHFVYLGKRAPCFHLGDHAETLHIHGAVTGDQTDDDSTEKLPFAECRAASHAGATTPVFTRQTRYLFNWLGWMKKTTKPTISIIRLLAFHYGKRKILSYWSLTQKHR